MPPKLLRHSHQNELSYGSALQEQRKPQDGTRKPHMYAWWWLKDWFVVGVENPSQSLGKSEAMRFFFISSCTQHNCVCHCPHLC